MESLLWKMNRRKIAITTRWRCQTEYTLLTFCFENHCFSSHKAFFTVTLETLFRSPFCVRGDRPRPLRPWQQLRRRPPQWEIWPCVCPPPSSPPVCAGRWPHSPGPCHRWPSPLPHQTVSTTTLPQSNRSTCRLSPEASASFPTTSQVHKLTFYSGTIRSCMYLEKLETRSHNAGLSFGFRQLLTKLRRKTT